MRTSNSKLNKERDFLRTEFHTHTIYSKDSLTPPKKLIKACIRKGIDRIAVTDHNTIQGALKCKELDPERVIVGEEIMTTQGEILAFFLTDEISPALSPMETIELLRKQDAFICVSHPCDTIGGRHWDAAELIKIIPHLDAIETFNARCIAPWSNWQAEKIAREHNLPGIHGSDAHTILEVGRGTLLLPPFHDRVTLVESLNNAVSPKLTLSSPLIHFSSRYAVWRKRIKSK